MSNVKLGQRSIDRLNTVHPDLQKVIYKAFESMPFDVTVLEGVRSVEQQKANVAKGVSQTMNSKHLKQADGYSHAVDIAPYPVDWNNKSRFNQQAEIVMNAAKELGIKVRWGGDWNRNGDWRDEKFYDGPHFELDR